MMIEDCLRLYNYNYNKINNNNNNSYNYLDYYYYYYYSPPEAFPMFVIRKAANAEVPMPVTNFCSTITTNCYYYYSYFYSFYSYLKKILLRPPLSICQFTLKQVLCLRLLFDGMCFFSFNVARKWRSPKLFCDIHRTPSMTWRNGSQDVNLRKRSALAALIHRMVLCFHRSGFCIQMRPQMSRINVVPLMVAKDSWMFSWLPATGDIFPVGWF